MIFSNLFERLATRKRQRKNRKLAAFGKARHEPSRTAPRGLKLEPLEQRQLLAMITVNTVLDVVDANLATTSLREAIIEANTNMEDDVITLPAGTYEMSIFGAITTSCRIRHQPEHRPRLRYWPPWVRAQTMSLLTRYRRTECLTCSRLMRTACGRNSKSVRTVRIQPEV
jgi:hypothetical protein